MLKGIAHAGGGDTPENRYGVVVALSQLTQTLAGATGDSVLTAAAETSAALLRVRKVVLFTATGQELETSGSVGLAGAESVVSAARDIAAAALSTNAPLVIPNTNAASSAAAGKLVRAGVVSVICVPMRVSETSVGAIVAMSDELRAFSPGDVEILHVVASHAALAALRCDSRPIVTEPTRQDEVIRLADRKIQELSILNQVSDAMSSTLDLRALLDIALEQSLAAVGADAGSLMLISEETAKLEIVASRGLDRKWVEGTSQNVGQSIAGWVAQHGESVLVTDAHKDDRFSMPFYRDNISSSASVPLKCKGAVIGVLNVNTGQANKLFDERDLELLGTVANQMAVAIENARLYSRVNRRTQQLTSLLQISKTVTSTLNLDEVLRRLTEEICSLFQLDVCVVLMLDELNDRLRFGYGTGLKSRRKYAYYDVAAPIAARIRSTGRKLTLRNINASPSLATDVSKSEGLKVAVGIPLRNQGRLVGTAVGFTRDARVFRKSQNAIMKPLGDLAGVAIDNARVYRNKYRIAEMLQQRLVPSEAPRIAGLDIGCKLVPAREVGGDFYDFINVGSGKVAVALSDVAGSDVEAAEYTVMGKHVLRAYGKECISPAQVLAKANDLVCEDTSAEVFISSFYGVLDVSSRTLRYATAGCEPGLLYRAHDGSITTLTADGILLGIRSGCEYQEREERLNPGDILALYTDGLPEACVGNRRFGAEAVMELLRANAHRTAQEAANAIHDALLEFVHGRVTDDVAVLIVKMQ